MASNDDDDVGDPQLIAAIEEHAKFLGLDIKLDSDLLYLAEECLLSPPPGKLNLYLYIYIHTLYTAFKSVFFHILLNMYNIYSHIILFIH